MGQGETPEPPLRPRSRHEIGLATGRGPTLVRKDLIGGDEEDVGVDERAAAHPGANDDVHVVVVADIVHSVQFTVLARSPANVAWMGRSVRKNPEVTAEVTG